jgi:GT2 family glycosyltransferase
MTAELPRPRLSVVIATHDNLPVLRRCLTAWQRWAADQPVELLVVDDGCTDGTSQYLASALSDAWGTLTIRALHEDNVHELMCTNRGFREAAAPLIMSWHDDMFLESRWFVPELLATFEAYPDIGLLSLSRGLRCFPLEEPVRTFDDSVDWRRLQSTIGGGPLNWLRLVEVDAVMRPWVVRRACIDRVGPLDEIYRPTEWDEADFCFRIRAAGWKVATHGFERDGAYEHLLSTTYGRTPSERRQAAALRNALVFHDRWDATIAEEHGRRRRHWRRPLSVEAALGTLQAAAGTIARRLAGKRRRRAEPA